MRKLLIITFLSLVLLASCTNNSNTIDNIDFKKGQWIHYNGDIDKNKGVSMSEKLDYDSDSSYKVNTVAYVSYYNEDQFIKTIKYDGKMPETIKNVKNANKIIISVFKKDESKFKLMKQ